MAVSEAVIREVASTTLTRALFRYFVRKQVVQTKHMVLSKMFPDETKLRSSIGSLETSLGTSLWESLARELASRNGIQLLEDRPLSQPVYPRSSSFDAFLGSCIKERESAKSPGKLSEFRRNLAARIRKGEFGQPRGWKPLTAGEGVDLHFKKGTTEYAIDIKTVQINAGGGKKFNQLLMRWTAYGMLRSAAKVDLRAHLALPYDPTCGHWWNQFGGRVAPLDDHDVLVGAPFWELLTDNPSAMHVIDSGFERASEILKSRYKPLLLRELSLSDIKRLLDQHGVKSDVRGEQLYLRCQGCGRPSRGCSIAQFRAVVVSKRPPACAGCGKALLAEAGIA